MWGSLNLDIQRCDKTGKVSLDDLTRDVIRHQTLHLDEHPNAVQFVHAHHQIANCRGAPQLPYSYRWPEAHSHDGQMHLIPISDRRLMLLARQDVLSWALDREQVLTVHGAQTREWHPAPIIAIAPAVRGVGLVVLPDMRTQLNSPCAQRGTERRQVVHPKLDLDLAHG